MRTPVLFALTILGAIGSAGAYAADPGNPAVAGSVTKSAAGVVTKPPVDGTTPRNRVSVLTGEQVIQILDETVDWYRTLGTQQQNATQPSDLLILFANRQTADKVVALSFEIARANAELLSSEANAAQSSAAQSTEEASTPEGSSPQALSQRQNELDAKRQEIKRQMSDGKHPELQGEIAMLDARKNLLDTMTEFVNSSDPKSAGANNLKAQIDAIAATIPSSGANPATAASSAATGSSAAASVASDANKAAPVRSGLWDLATNVFKLRNKVDSIEVIDKHTADLARTFDEISAPPLKQLKAYSARSDALTAQSDAPGDGTHKELRGQFDTLAWLFKQTSDILVPLTKEKVLLRQYRHNLGNWRDSAERQYHDALAALGIRTAVLAAILAVVFGLAEIWRRAVLRYSHEPRRRSQLLLVRTIVLWTVVLAIVGLSFVNEISTFATFAGLLTAGVAVAMQSVLVSVVGYFFLIGKYGIRVGDRIQIGAVVGEVIDIGLVRMHLMELNQSGPLGPTGRVVAFANLIVFQASGGLFKQIPGVNFAWHENTLTLPVVDDYGLLKEKLLAAISAVVGHYSEEISRQTKEIEKTTATSSVTNAVPQVQMHLANGRMEALIRYPVHREHAAEVDEGVAQAVMKVIAESNPSS
ncbi:MAG: mechanosensitive ion channel domain-containing protein [Gammaproteobacteria bacterium]